MSFSPSNLIGNQVNLSWFTFEPLKGPVASFDCIFTNISKPWFIETFCNCRSLRNSFLCNVLQDGSEKRHGVINIIQDRMVQTSAAYMLKFMQIYLHQLPSLNLFTWVRANFPEEKKSDGLERVISMEVKVPLAE